jgi:hypothetical protein
VELERCHWAVLRLDNWMQAEATVKKSRLRRNKPLESRSPPKRNKPMPQRKKAINKVSGKERRKLSDPDRKLWKLAHGERCMCCHLRVGVHGCQLHCHEMLDGSRYNRPFDTRNYLMLCGVRYDGKPMCHNLTKGRENDYPTLTLGMQLMFKQLDDPANYDWQWIKSIVGKNTPEPEEIHPVFVRERSINECISA